MVTAVYDANLVVNSQVSVGNSAGPYLNSILSNISIYNTHIVSHDGQIWDAGSQQKKEDGVVKLRDST